MLDLYTQTLLSNVLSVLGFCRVPCSFRSTIAFRLAKGTNKDYIAFAPEFLNGDGDLAAVDLIVSRNNKVLPMKRSFGDTWATGFAPFTNVGPYSVRLTTLWSRKTIVAQNVIPVDWVKYPAGTIFRSRVNF